MDEQRDRQAYDEGFAAALRGEEAAPGCTVTPAGRAWLRGYVDGAASRAPAPAAAGAAGDATGLAATPAKRR